MKPSTVRTPTTASHENGPPTHARAQSKSLMPLFMTLAGATTLLGCALDAGTTSDAPAGDQFETHKQAIFGGELTDGATYEAVGSLAIRIVFEDVPGEPPFIYHQPFCSGTLIGNKAVLTARHCTEAANQYISDGLEVVFAFGSSGWDPEQAVQIVDWKEAPPSPTHPGLLLDGGRDIAVAYLAEEAIGIRPAKIGLFKEKQADDELVIVGYGRTDYFFDEIGYYEGGYKLSGTTTGRALGGPWYSLLFNGDYDAYLQWYFADAVTGSPSEEEALEWWNIYNLEPGYELLAGTPGQEAFGCFGDSGGPLAIAKKNKFTVYGVGFATESSQSTDCTGGSAYLVLNQEMHAFVRKALADCED